MPERRVLVAIVDNDPDVLQALSRLLLAAGYRTRTFAAGETLLESFSFEPPDCVVLDIHMPGLSGLAVQAQLSQRHGPVPVILVTGNESDVIRARGAGAAGLLPKPIDERVLILAIEQATSRNGTSLGRTAIPSFQHESSP